MSKDCDECGKKFFKPYYRSQKSWKTAKFCSVACKNKSKEFSKAVSLATKGKKRTEETRKKISIAQKGRIAWNKGKKCPQYGGENHYAWKGGISSINEKIRNSIEYRLWRKSVFERDRYTCIWCKRKGVKLNADHIKPFSLFPELRFAIDNGRTLCEDCHRKTDTYGWKMQNINRKEIQ